MSSASQLAKAIAALTLPGAASEAVAVLVDIVGDQLDAKDQATLQQALGDAQAENDAGHARLQQKLREAQG